MIIKATDIAYLAGYVDRGGSFKIEFNTPGWEPARRARHPVHRPLLSLSSANLELMEHLRDTYGTKRTTISQKVVRGRSYYQVSIYGNRLRTLTAALLPHLKKKRREAELVLQMLDTRTNTGPLRLPDAVLEKRNAIYKEFITLPGRSTRAERVRVLR